MIAAPGSLMRPTVKTPFTINEGALSLRKAAGADPNYQGLSLVSLGKALAVALLETGSGDSCYCHNAKNMRPRTRTGVYTDPWYRHPGKVSEVVGGVEVFADGPEDPMRVFRAFLSFGECFLSGLDWIRTRHSKAWALLLDDAAGVHHFAETFASPNDLGLRYCTANIDRYAAGVSLRYGVAVAAVGGKTLLPALRAGSRNPEVSMWQKLLRISVTGVFDPETSRAVLKWQGDQGGEAGNPDGVIGALSRMRAGFPVFTDGGGL